MPAFRYSDSEWISISNNFKKLPSYGQASEAAFRTHMEQLVTAWRFFAPDKRQKTLQEWGKIENALDVLNKALDTEVGKFILSDHQELRLAGIEVYGDIANGIKRSSQTADYWWRYLGEFSNKQLAHRDQLLTGLILAWEFIGGEARSSTAFETGAPSGPLIRYLIATSVPAGISLTPESARAFVRKHRKSLIRSTGAASLDQAYERLREFHKRT